VEISNKHPHQPVLLEQVLELLSPQKGDRYLDLTAGYGGHASAVLAAADIRICVLVDRDQTAIEYLEGRFIEHGAVQLVHADMVSALSKLRQNNQEFDLVLLDAGVSSLQLDEPERGFSFRYDAPLDMRMDIRSELTAKTIVNTWSERDIAKIIRTYGEEQHATRIAHAIVEHRPIDTTMQLAEVVKQTNRRHTKIHPATKTFQALRIAVNDELQQLEQALHGIDQVLAPGGRVAMISFHSLEDRIVKKYYNPRSKGFEATYRNLTKRPITAHQNDTNPRARSAKLRAAVKLKQKQKGEIDAN